MKYYQVGQGVHYVTRSIDAFQKAIDDKEIKEVNPDHSPSWATGVFSFDGKEIKCVRENWDSSD